MAKGLTISICCDSLNGGDPRFGVLGDIAGYNEDEALGKMVRLWDWCLKRQTFEQPPAMIIRYLGPKGVEAILGGGEDSLALGERRGELIYVRGSKEHLSWLGDHRERAELGGAARAAGAARDGDGRFRRRESGPDRPPGPDQSDVRPTTTDWSGPADPPAGARSGPADHQPFPDPLPCPDPDPNRGRGRAAARRPPRIPIPIDWTPTRTPSLAQLEADAIAIGADVDRALAKFKRHARAHDWRRADWDAAWEKWLCGEHPAIKKPPARAPPSPTKSDEDRQRDDEYTRRAALELGDVISILRASPFTPKANTR